jgi:hypothetical protein
MTLLALLSAGFVLGVAFNVYVLLALALLVIPIFFAASLHLGLLQAAVSTLLSVTVFEFGYVSGFMAHDRFLRRFPSGPNWSSMRRRIWTVRSLNGFPRSQTHAARSPSFFRPVSEFFARATRLFVVAAQIWNDPL